MLKAPQYRRRRHNRRRLFLAKQIAITYLKPGASERSYSGQGGHKKDFVLEHATRMMATETQVPVCGCCGEHASTVFEAIAMIYTSSERPLCDTCWKTQGSASVRPGNFGWMYSMLSSRFSQVPNSLKNLLEEEEESI